jgi:hypothetical protein
MLKRIVDFIITCLSFNQVFIISFITLNLAIIRKA